MEPWVELRVVGIEGILILHLIGDGGALFDLLLASFVSIGAGIAQLALSCIGNELTLPIEATENGLIVIDGSTVQEGPIALRYGYSILRMMKGGKKEGQLKGCTCSIERRSD